MCSSVREFGIRDNSTPPAASTGWKPVSQVGPFTTDSAVHHHQPKLADRFFSRREMLARCGMGMGALSLAGLFGELASPRAAQAAEAVGAASPGAINPLAARPPMFPGRAKRVIHFFLNGGPSHVDTFDPKPLLERYADKPLPTPNLPTERKTGAAFPSPFKFAKHGQSGLEISDLFPHLSKCADDLCVIRSMTGGVP